MNDDCIVRLPPDWHLLSVATPLAQIVDWSLTFLGIPELWLQTRGKGLKVGVADTGVANHIDLQGAIAGLEDFTNSLYGADDVAGHGCIAPTDLVYTSLCGLQAIERVFENAGGIAHFLPDSSITLDVSRRNLQTISLDDRGRYVRSKILAVHKLPYRGQVFNVRTRDGSLTLTPWHPVYVETSRRGDDRTIVKKRADELKVGDKVVVSGESVGVTDERISLVVDQEWACRFCGRVASRGNGLRTVCRGCKNSNWHEGPRDVRHALDEDLSYLAGLVASDGHLSKKEGQYAVLFSNNDERLHLQFANLCINIFGAAPSRRGGSDVELNCKRAWLTLRAVGIPVGAKSRTIEFPELVAKSPRSVIFAFIAGIIEGDGSVRNRLRVATGSRRFADGLAMLCRTLGIRASVSVVKPSKKGIAKTLLESYSIHISGDAELLSYLRVKNGSVVEKAQPRQTASIVSIEQSSYRGSMFDFTVEGSHNYVANGHIVSNTWCFGQMLARANDVGVIGVLNEAQGYSAKVLSDNGSGTDKTIYAGLKWLIDHGCDIISMSFGGRGLGARVRGLLKEYVQQGGMPFAAAGNDGGPVNDPAAWPETIGVGAVDKAGKLTRFTSRGPSLDILAPGYAMVSTIPNNKYGEMTGSSMSCPTAAAIGGLALSKHRMHGGGTDLKNVEQMREHLKKTATATAGGFGLINPVKLLDQFGEQPPEKPDEPWRIPLGLFGELHVPAVAGDSVGWDASPEGRELAIQLATGRRP